MSIGDGAKGIKGEHIKPADITKRGDCPCDAFIKCSARPPYGRDIWAISKTRKQACGAIAYDTEGIVTDEKKNQLLRSFQYFEKKYSGEGYNNSFFKNIRLMKNCARKVLTMPKITYAELLAQMKAHKNLILNTGYFTDFQKSIILRANMVRNGLELRSDIYEDEKGSLLYKEEKLYPCYRGNVAFEWRVDHIQTRSKGACNRFCNAAVLRDADNRDKWDKWHGCPCVDALMGEAGKEPFEFIGDSKKYQLYNCKTYCDNKEDKDKVEKLPAAPLGTLNKYRKKGICPLDNPFKFDLEYSKGLMQKATEICESGQ